MAQQNKRVGRASLPDIVPSISSKDYKYHNITTKPDGRIRSALKLSKAKFDSFGPNNLGLGNLSTKSTATDSLAAIFDLAGFTNFCKQIEPHLSVPVFLNNFLEWLFEEIKSEMSFGDDQEETILWCLMVPIAFLHKIFR